MIIDKVLDRLVYRVIFLIQLTVPGKNAFKHFFTRVMYRYDVSQKIKYNH